MSNIVDSPLLVLVISLVALLLSAQTGVFFRKNLRPLADDERADFAVVLTATLTLLGLIIGFSFSMVISRYDQRKNYEEEAAKVRELLRTYLDQRVRFYETREVYELSRINAHTAQLQTRLWSVVQAVASRQPTPPVALAVSGMNDVLNSQGYTQAAWWNRFPLAAWGLLVAIAVFCNLLIGYGSRRSGMVLLSALPPAVSISFFLIADISSPRQGLIRVLPQNLIGLSSSLRAQ